MINRSFGDIWDEYHRGSAAWDIIEDVVDEGTGESEKFTAYNTYVSIFSGNLQFVFGIHQI